MKPGGDLKVRSYQFCLFFLASFFFLFLPTVGGETVISCLGDSVTHGYPYADNGNPQYTYPNQLLGLLEAEYGAGSFAIHNQGVNGYKAENVVCDLEQPGALSEDPDYVLLKIGGNDLAGADIFTILQIIEETTWEVQSCVDLVKAHVNGDGSQPKLIVSAFIPNLIEGSLGSLAVSLYNTSLADNLSGYDVWFTANWDDFYDGETGEAKTGLMYDSTHPNVEGYAVMAENWFAVLQTSFGSPPPSPSPTPTPKPTVPPWPGGGGTEIGGNLPGGYEPSGIVWHERLGLLFLVGDGGQVSRMDENGGAVMTWSPGGDIEGIAVADPENDYIYLGIENPDSIREFDISQGELTGATWSLTTWMTGASNQGLEALTFVPNGYHPYDDSDSGGLFYAGLQADGKIYVFDIDLSSSGSVSHVHTITPFPGRADISGLHYCSGTGTLYAIFDSWNLLMEMEADGTFVAECALAGNDQEGFTLKPACPSAVTTAFIAEDTGKEVWKYESFPVDCLPTPTPTPSVPPTPTPSPTSAPSPSPPPPTRTPSPAPTVTPSAPPAPSATPTPTSPPSPTPSPRPFAGVFLTVYNSVEGKSPAYLGGNEGGGFQTSDLTDCGANLYRIWTTMGELEYYDDDWVAAGYPGWPDYPSSYYYGSPGVAAIKADVDLVPWAVWDDAFTRARWTTAVPFDELLDGCLAEGAEPLLVLRTKGPDDSWWDWIPNAPDGDDFWTEWWEYCFAAAYWCNVRNSYGVTHFQVHNEPDLAWQGWEGSQAEYVQLIEYARDALLFANTMAGLPVYLHAPVVSNYSSSYISYCLDNADDYIDVVDYHVYDKFHDLSTSIQTVKQTITAYNPDGVEEPLWITEWGDLDHNYDSLNRGLLTASQLYRMAEGGVEGSAIFMFYDWGSDESGLIDEATFSPYESYYAFRLMLRGLQGGKDLLACDSSEPSKQIMATREGDSLYLLAVGVGNEVRADISAFAFASDVCDLYEYSASFKDGVSAHPVIEGGIVSFSAPTEAAFCLIVPLAEITPPPSPTPTPCCDKIILGYYPYWNEDYRSDKIPYRNLTHICHAFVRPQADGSILAPPGPPPYLEPELLASAHAFGVKVLVSVGGYDPVADENFRTIAADPLLRQEFALNLEAFCRAHGYDGVDLDWEFPQDASDRSNQNLLFQEVRETFNSSSEPAPSWLLTMAISSGNWYGQWSDYTALSEYVTFYNLMAYDGHGDWSGHMGHNAPLFRGGDPYDDVSVEAAVDYNVVTRGISPSQIILGLPFYGYQWPTVEELYDTCSPCNASQMVYREIYPLVGDGWTRIWDDSAKVPYLTDDSGPGVISYDDAQSIEKKVLYALDTRGLRGIFAWEISGDYLPPGQPLLEQVHRTVLQFCGLTPTPTPVPKTPSPTPPPTASPPPTQSATPSATPPTPTPTPIPKTPSPTPPPAASPTCGPVVPAERAGIESGDYDGDGTDDPAVFRPSSGLWAVRGITAFYFGRDGDAAVSGDYDGDGTTDPGIFRQTGGFWAVRSVTRAYFGMAADLPVPADYDGDGRADITIFRESTGLWAIRYISRTYYGKSGDWPIPGDYTGEGNALIAIYRPSTGLWAVKGIIRIYYGRDEDWPVPGDYDGDSTWNIGIYRPSTGLWALREVSRFYFGTCTDWPRPADYRGEGRDGTGIFRPPSGLWAIKGLTRFYFGQSGDKPVVR